MLSVAVFMNSSKKGLDLEPSSVTEEHNSFIASGTFPQMCVTFIQSERLPSGSNFWTSCWEDESSSFLILTAWCPWKRKSKNLKDSLVVRRKVTLSLRFRISSSRLITSSFTFGTPLSSKSSALSRMKTQCSDISSNFEQSSSSAAKLCASVWWSSLSVVDWRSKPRNFDVRSPLDFIPRNDMKYTGRPCAWRSCPTAITTDVFPNPGEPHTDTSRVEAEVTWPIISSHSFSRPVKLGTFEGRHDLGRRGFDSVRKEKIRYWD